MAQHDLTDSEDEPTPPPKGKTVRAGSSVAAPRSASTAATTSRAANGRQHASTSGTRRSGSTTAARDEDRAASRYSVSATPDPEPSSSILTTSDAPTVAAYASTSRAAGRANNTVSPEKPRVSTAPARARPKPKRAVLDPEAQRQLELNRQKDREAADFFTYKKEVNFRTKGVALKPKNPSPKKKDPTPVPGPSRSSASQSPSATPNKGKSKAIIYDLDDDDGESSSSSISTDDDDSDSRGGSKPKKKKVVKPEPRRASPLKRSEPISDSSSTDSDFSSTFGSSSPGRAQTKKDKHQAKKVKNEPAPAPLRQQSRSLSPLEKVDSYTLAHAIQDMRRKEQMNRAQHMHDSYQVNGDDEESLLFGVTRPVASTSAASPAQAAARPAGLPQAAAQIPIDIDDDDNEETQGRQQSASQITRPYTLAPLVEAKPLTEEELEAKYGPAMSINIQMVWDPRQPGPEVEHVRPYFEAFRAPLNFSVRPRENFNKLFERVAADKHIPKEHLTFTYNGKTVYSYGTPNAIHIISGATFLGFTKHVLHYIKQNKMMDDTGAIKILQPARTSAAAVGGAPNGGMQGSLAANVATPSGVHASGEATEGTQLNSPSTPATGRIPIILRGGKDQKIMIQAPKTHTVFKLIKYFLKKSGLDVSKAAQCKLSFDGEELDHDLLIGDSEVEDEDTLDVKVPA